MCGGSRRGLRALLFLAGVGRAVPVPVMYGGRGRGLRPPRRHVFGADGFQSAGSILKRRDTSLLQEEGQAPKFSGLLPGCSCLLLFQVCEAAQEPELSYPLLFHFPLQPIKAVRTVEGVRVRVLFSEAAE